MIMIIISTITIKNDNNVYDNMIKKGSESVLKARLTRKFNSI